VNGRQRRRTIDSCDYAAWVRVLLACIALSFIFHAPASETYRKNIKYCSSVTESI